jgi:hypothetical protein
MDEDTREVVPNLPSTATAVLDTVGASAVPCHADKQTTIVTEIGRPVVLAVGLRRYVSQCKRHC